MDNIPEEDRLDLSDDDESTAFSASSTDFSQPLSSEPAMGAVLDEMSCGSPAKDRPISLDHLYEPYRLDCAIKIDDFRIMGDPFSVTQGRGMKLILGPGRSGRPFIGLTFRFAKDGINSRSTDHCETFGIGWEPGVKIGGELMIEGMHFEKTFPPAIEKLCRNENDYSRLYCMAFKSNAHKTSPLNMEMVKNLENDDWFANLERMFGAAEPSYTIMVWFMGPALALENFEKTCLRPLKDAVNNNTPPSSQHLDEYGDPVMNLYQVPIHDVKPQDLGKVHQEAEKPLEETIEANEADPIFTREHIEALEAEILKLRTENNSLQTLTQDQSKTIRELAEDLRQSRKGHDKIMPVAEKMKHQRNLKPAQIQKALNAIAKTSD